MPHVHGPLRLSSRDAVARLQPFLSLEELSPVSGAQALVIEIGGAPPELEDGADLHRAIRHLRELPCPSIGVGRTDGLEIGPGTAFLLEALDLLVTEEELAVVLDAVAKCPIAAMALVQLLRLGEALQVHEALIAESLVYSTLQSGPEFKDWLAQQKREPSVPSRLASPAAVSSRKANCLEILLNRPERHNAYSAEMRDALTEALEVAVADPSIEEIVLRGSGTSFSAGGDLSEFGTLPDPATAHAIRSTRSAARLLARCGERVRVEVQGACIGAGVELPAFAAHVVAREDAYFQLPELSMGLIPGAGGTASIPRRIGRQRAAYLALSGARIDARDARAWGLVDEVTR
jgi:enoyl-CoA hydratase